MFNVNALKKSLEIQSLDESELVKPKDYISTGNYAVNKIIAGSIYRGIPSNRITTFYGESGCVPNSTKIYVMLQTDIETNTVLENIPNTKLFDSFLERLPIADKLNMLMDIGYTMTDISRKTKFSRQTLYTLLNSNSIAPKKNRGEKSSYYSVNMLVRRHIFVTEIKNVALFYQNNRDFLVLTPVGFRRCSNLIDKGEKSSVALLVEDCEKTYVSEDHLVQLANGKFEFAKNILEQFEAGTFNEQIKTIMGNKKLLGASQYGTLRMYDIEIADDCHAYYADDVVAHNSGKSLIVSEIIANALGEKNYDAVFYLDSEGGILYDKLAASIDMSKCFHIPVTTIEECNIHLQKIFAEIETAYKDAKGDPSKEPHVLVVLDSFSGLETNKLIDDAQNGKMAQDMGLKAKLKNAMIRPLMTKVMKYNCPIVMVAHAYDNMNAMGPQKFKVLAGGNGIMYSSHVVVQSTKSLKRQEDKAKGLAGGSSYYESNAIRYITAKNRLVKQGLETTLWVDLNKGIAKYYGLWDDAVRLGFIEQMGAWYRVPSYATDKKFRKDEIAENDEVWATFLDDMDKIFIKETAYGTGTAPTAPEMAKEAEA